tara:strand:- start:986 stop:1918 length:933 start_codon:yes stop_codon:yes gene_type:complete
MSKLEIITYATHIDGYYNILLDSVKNNNLKITTLGFNTKWKGFTDKLYNILKYLKTKDPNLIIIFVDGYDVIFNKNYNSKEILKKYYQFNKPIIFSKEIFSHFFPSINGIIMNTGLYMGKVENIINMLTNVLEFNKNKNIMDDQFLLNLYYKNNIKLFNKNIAIDNDNILFWNLPSYEGMNKIICLPSKECNVISKLYKLDINLNQIKNLDKNNQPIAIQGNGAANIDRIVKLLNYDINKKIDRNIYSTFRFKQIINLIYYNLLYNYKYKLLVLIILLILIIYIIFILKVNFIFKNLLLLFIIIYLIIIL